MFGRLHVYTVHIRPASRMPYESAEFVKEGFCWPAFFFGMFWALYHRMWMAAFLIAAFNVALAAVIETVGASDTGATILQLGFQIITGFLADELLRNHLRRQGYSIADIVASETLPRGQQRFFERHVG